jgi:hypothetical protein
MVAVCAYCSGDGVACAEVAGAGAGPDSGPDIFLGKTYAKVLGSFFVGFMVNKSRVLFTIRSQPVERFLISTQLWSL